MSSASASAWDHPTKINIGKALLAEGNGLTAAQMEAFLGKPHQSNLKKRAEEMVGAGVLEKVAPASQNGSPGRPAQVAFAFARGEQQRFEELIEGSDEPQGLEVNTPIVFVDAEQNHERLQNLLSTPGAVPGAGESYALAGKGEQLMVPFRGPNAVDDSRDFLDALDELELKAERRFITKVSSSSDLRADARRSKKRIEQRRKKLRAMQTEPRPER